MTEQDIIKNIKLSKKFSRQFEDYSNYFIFLFPATITLIGLNMTFGFFKHKSEITQLGFSFAIVSFGIFASYFTLKRLKENISFETIENKKNLSLKNLKDEIEKNFRVKAIFLEDNLELIEVQTKISGFSWGERITILKDGNFYLVNSKPNQPVTIYKDRTNINKIRKILNN